MAPETRTEAEANHGPRPLHLSSVFLWTRDTSTFHFGLDRIDDVCLRQFFMWTGCRKHELVYAKPRNLLSKVREYDEESDAFTDVEDATDEYVRMCKQECWVCGQAEERERNPQLQLLCWEDVDLWILRDPAGTGRDRLAMQILLRWHKGVSRQVVPIWYLFVEENLLLCPITHILAKALAEGVINDKGYQIATDPFFATKLDKPAVKIRWKAEWLYKLVFCSTAKVLGKEDEPLRAKVFDNHSDRLGKAMGFSERLSQYTYRRGYAEYVDGTFLFPIYGLFFINITKRIITNLYTTKG